MWTLFYGRPNPWPGQTLFREKDRLRARFSVVAERGGVDYSLTQFPEDGCGCSIARCVCFSPHVSYRRATASLCVRPTPRVFEKTWNQLDRWRARRIIEIAQSREGRGAAALLGVGAIALLLRHAGIEAVLSAIYHAAPIFPILLALEALIFNVQHERAEKFVRGGSP